MTCAIFHFKMIFKDSSLLLTPWLSLVTCSFGFGAMYVCIFIIFNVGTKCYRKRSERHVMKDHQFRGIFFLFKTIYISSQRSWEFMKAWQEHSHHWWWCSGKMAFLADLSKKSLCEKNILSKKSICRSALLSNLFIFIILLPLSFISSLKEMTCYYHPFWRDLT